MNGIIGMALCIFATFLSFATVHADELLPEDLTSIKTPTPGTWNTNWKMSYDYAVERHLPFVSFAGEIGCSHAVKGIHMLNDPTLRSFFTANPMVMAFAYASHVDVTNTYYAKSAESSSNPDYWYARQLKNRLPKQLENSGSGYPVMCLEWIKESGSTTGICFTAQNQQMPSLEPKGSDADKLAMQFINTMKMYFAGYKNISGGGSQSKKNTTGIGTLMPSDPDKFYDNLDYSPDVRLGVWSGNTPQCFKKARETGYLLLWFITSIGDGYECKEFLRSNLCNQPFCDVVNEYKYLILCCSDYGSRAVSDLKDSIYGYPEPKKILDENTGEMVENHRGYPIKTIINWTKEGDPITIWCDYPPSIHLIKVDVNTNIIFHICKREGAYESEFSPYAAKFPIPANMNISMNLFAPWLKQYLDMYPAAEQIEEYENSASTKIVNVDKTITEYVTNTTYQQKTVAVTETMNPTVYQMSIHRDNILFRSVTSLGDIEVVDRIGENFKDFDGRVYARNSKGKWYVNHDRELASNVSSVSDTSSIELYASTNCTIDLNQRFRDGFTVEGYIATVEKSIETQGVVTTNKGEIITVTTTNLVVATGSSPFMSAFVRRNEMFSTNLVEGRIYRVTTTGNATFDVFSTR